MLSKGYCYSIGFWLTNNLSIILFTRTVMGSCSSSGSTRTVVRPSLFPPLISVNNWSPITAVSSGISFNLT